MPGTQRSAGRLAPRAHGSQLAGPRHFAVDLLHPLFCGLTSTGAPAGVRVRHQVAGGCSAGTLLRVRGSLVGETAVRSPNASRLSSPPRCNARPGVLAAAVRAQAPRLALVKVCGSRGAGTRRRLFGWEGCPGFVFAPSKRRQSPPFVVLRRPAGSEGAAWSLNRSGAQLAGTGGRRSCCATALGRRRAIPRGIEEPGECASPGVSILQGVRVRAAEDGRPWSVSGAAGCSRMRMPRRRGGTGMRVPRSWRTRQADAPLWLAADRTGQLGEVMRGLSLSSSIIKADWRNRRGAKTPESSAGSSRR